VHNIWQPRAPVAPDLAQHPRPGRLTQLPVTRTRHQTRLRCRHPPEGSQQALPGQ
jgi:hypothetical protein